MSKTSCKQSENSRKIIVPEGKFCAACPYFERSAKYCNKINQSVSYDHVEAYCITTPVNVDRDSLTQYTCCPYY